MRETYKDINVGNRTFRIHKFDALTGSYVIYTVLTQLLPMGLGNQIEGLEGNRELPAMSKEKFSEIQKDCLKICEEIVPAGNSIAPVKVLLSDGRWGIPDLENDVATVMVLTIHALGYNVKSFFEGNVLEEFKSSMSQLS